MSERFYSNLMTAIDVSRRRYLEQINEGPGLSPYWDIVEKQKKLLKGKVYLDSTGTRCLDAGQDAATVEAFESLKNTSWIKDCIRK